MGLVFPQTSNGQTISVPSGTTVGRILLTKHDCVFEGVGQASVLQTDGVAGSLVGGAFPVQTPDGQPVSRVTLRNLTLDLLDNTGITAAVAGNTFAGPLEIYLENVWVKGHTGVAFQAASTELYGTGLDIRGKGTAVKLLSSATANLSDVLVVGGAGGFISDNSACKVQLTDWDVRLYWWAVPTGEAVTVTAVTDTQVTVDSHVTADRSTTGSLRALVPAGSWPGATLRRWQRLVAEDGRWAHVVTPGVIEGWHAADSWAPASAPATATVYDVRLARTTSWTDTTISYPYWRNPSGRRVDRPPSSATFVVLRSSGANRDVDTGALHLQDAVDGALVRRFKQYGGYSDGLTVRGNDCVLEDCKSSHAQDMGSTNGGDGLKGRNIWRRCEFRKGGYSGAYVCLGQAPTYEDCRFVSCGTQNTLGHGAIDDAPGAIFRRCLWVGNRSTDIG